MAKIKIPSTPKETQAPPIKKKRRVRLKNVSPSAQKRRLVARAKIIARKRLACPRKPVQSFREAFGASDDEVSVQYFICITVRVCVICSPVQWSSNPPFSPYTSAYRARLLLWGSRT